MTVFAFATKSFDQELFLLFSIVNAPSKMAHLAVIGAAMAMLVVLIIVYFVYKHFHGKEIVPWENSVMAGEMRSKLYPSASYRCCTTGDWVCTNRGCGSGSWADASTCGPVTYNQDAALSSTC